MIDNTCTKLGGCCCVLQHDLKLRPCVSRQVSLSMRIGPESTCAARGMFLGLLLLLLCQLNPHRW